MFGEAFIFFVSVLLGASEGLLYDFFRVFRMAFKHPKILVQIEDVLFWIIASFSSFYILLNINNGEIRGFLLFGLAFGMIFYFMTLSNLFLTISSHVLNFLKKVFETFFSIIAIPLKIISNILDVPLAYGKSLALKTKKPIKKLLQNSRRRAIIRREGFFKAIKIVFKKI